MARAVGRRAGEDAGGELADSLTYHAFLSLFPLLLLAASVIGFLLSRNPSAEGDWVGRLSGSVPGLGPLIARNLRAGVDGRAGAGIVGLVGFLWTGLGLVESGRNTLSRILRRARGSNVVSKKLRSVAALGGLGIVALASTTATGLLAGLGGGSGLGMAVRAFGILAAAGVDAGFFLVLYRVLAPGRGPAFRELVPGAVVMTVGWTGLKLGGTWYGIRVVAKATAVYGTFVAVIGVLALLSIACRMFVYGAELDMVLAEERHARAAP